MELIDPMIPISPIIPLDSSKEKVEPSIESEAQQRVMPLSWLREIAETGQTVKCEFGWINRPNVDAKSDTITSLPALAPAVAAPMVAYCPELPRIAQTEMSCDAGTKIKPYDTMRKLMQMVPLLVVNSELYAYNGVYYQHLSPSTAHQLIVKMCRNDVKAVGTPSFARMVYDLLLMEPELQRGEIEINQRVVAFRNGVFSLDTGDFLPHSPVWFITYCLECQYLTNGTAVCPHFDSFLAQITGGDVVLAERIWQMIGYALTPDTNGKVFFILQGVSNSGKSVLSALLTSFFNAEAVITLDVHDMSEKFALSGLQGKALCLSPDLPAGVLDNKAVSKLKQLTGNDVVSTDVKYRDHAQFRCTATIVLASNYPLLMRQHDEALIDRAVVIPFQFSVPRESRNPHLLDCLKAERDAIATRAIGAYIQLVRRQYRFEGNYSLNAVTATYTQSGSNRIDLSSCIFTFLQSCFARDEDCGIFTDDAHRLYVRQYGSISPNVFSSTFSSYANQLYGAVKARKRRDGGANPLSYISGIRLVSGEEV